MASAPPRPAATAKPGLADSHYRVPDAGAYAYGGLSKATQRRLAALSKELKLKGSVVVTPDLSLKPGARLVREWHGSTHTVVVTENGFEYAGTKIAHAITGAHWSGHVSLA